MSEDGILIGFANIKMLTDDEITDLIDENGGELDENVD